MKRRNRLIAGTAVLFLMLLLLPAGVFSRVWADTDTESYFLEDVANQKLQKVETAQWLVRVNKTVKSGKNKIEAGSYATVIKRDYRRLTGASLVQFPDSEETIRIKNTSLTWIKDLCVSKDYNERTKIEYVNRKGYSSKTNYLVWISLSRQSFTVFQGKRGNWHSIRQCDTSTGKATTPSPTGTYRVYRRAPYHEGVVWWSEYGGNGIHAWPGGGMAGVIGEHPASHGCVRLTYADAKWFYENIPMYTTVIIY